MKVFHSIEDVKDIGRPVLTLGVFDGVHEGHRRILEKVSRRALAYNTDSMVMTFDPHPRQVLGKHNQPFLFLTTLEERIQLLAKAGISALLIVPFTPELAAIEAEDFVKQVFVEKLNVLHIISGYDHTFGRFGKGNFRLLEQMSANHDFVTEEIPEHDIDMAAVSSTRTREALAAGKVDLAARLLGYPYFFSGSVVKGLQIGSSIGFPTANIEAGSPNKIMPSNGVYAVNVQFEGNTYHGMMNIGIRPTLNINNPSMEVHLFGCNENLYGKKLSVSFISFIREERKFDSLDALREQLNKDADEAKEKLKCHVPFFF